MTDALGPVRGVLDRLAAETLPPCPHDVWIDAYRQAIHDISVHAYPEDTL